MSIHRQKNINDPGDFTEFRCDNCGCQIDEGDPLAIIGEDVQFCRRKCREEWVTEQLHPGVHKFIDGTIIFVDSMDGDDYDPEQAVCRAEHLRDTMEDR